jgi:hypothetical protein
MEDLDDFGDLKALMQRKIELKKAELRRKLLDKVANPVVQQPEPPQQPPVTATLLKEDDMELLSK